MKKYYFALIFSFVQLLAFAQKDCEYAINVTDTIGRYKITPDYVMHERNFAGNSAYLFFSLAKVDDIPLLKLQYIQKSSDLIKVNCIDANSKVYLQLENGKIITLIHTSEESCGTMIRVDSENKYSRVTDGTFLFLNGTFDDLKSSPVSLLRLKFATETLDFPISKVIVSELTGQTYIPANYFMNFLKCVE